MNNELISFLTNQGIILNNYRQSLNKSIEDLQQILTNDSVLSLYAFLGNCNVSQLFISDNINKTKKLIECYRKCLALIDEDEKDRQEIIKSGFEYHLVNNYYEKSYKRNSELAKYVI